MGWRQTPQKMGTGPAADNSEPTRRGKRRSLLFPMSSLAGACFEPASQLFSVTLNLQLPGSSPGLACCPCSAPRRTCPPGVGTCSLASTASPGCCRGPDTQGRKREPQASPSPGPCPPGLLVLLLACLFPVSPPLSLPHPELAFPRGLGNCWELPSSKPCPSLLRMSDLEG